MESVALELKIWILGGAVAVLILLLGILFSIIRQVVKNFVSVTLPTIITKLDELIKVMETLKSEDALLGKDITAVQEKIKELKEHPKSCANYRPKQ